MSITYIADPCHPPGQVIKGATDVEESHVESVQEGQTLPQDKHSRQTRPPLRFWQQAHCPLRPSPQPILKAPLPGCCLPPADASSAFLPTFQLVFQAHQDLVQKVRQEGIAQDKEASSGSRWDLSFSGIHLDDADILFAQCLVTWVGEHINQDVTYTYS